MQENSKENKQDKEIEEMEEMEDDKGPGLDKQGAFYKAQREGRGASPCGYCNRGDCIECSFSR